MALPVPATPDMPVQGVVEVYLSTLTSPESRRAMESSLRTVTRILADATGADPDTHLDWSRLDWAAATTIRTLLRDRYATATTNRHLAAVRGVVKACHLSGLMDADQAARCREGLKSQRNPNGDGPDPSDRLLTTAELRTMFEVLASDTSVTARRDAAMFAILSMGGLRRAEVCDLDLADWNPDRGELLVRHGKGGKSRKVWLHEGAVAALEDWLTVRGSSDGPLLLRTNKGGKVTFGEAGRITPHAVWKRTKKLVAAAQVPDLAPHDFRRKVVTDLLDAGEDLVAVAKLAGHSQVTTTARYDRRGERAARRASAALHVPYVPPRTAAG